MKRAPEQQHDQRGAAHRDRPPERVPAERRRAHPMPLARRLLAVLIVLGVLGAFALLVWLAVQIRALTDNSHAPTTGDVQRAAQLFRMLSWILSASIVGTATWIGHFAWRIRREEVYPPPGSRHLRVRRVRRGDDARRVANICMALAVLLLICGLALAPLVTHLLASLGLQ